MNQDLLLAIMTIFVVVSATALVIQMFLLYGIFKTTKSLQAQAMSIMPQVKSILFNIFAGITRCDVVAQGMLQALDQTGIAHPIVVRFDGTNAEEGRQILVDSGRENIHVEATMLDAAKRAVELAA